MKPTMAAPDYQSLIDAETWGFIRENDAFYPPGSVSLGLGDQRRMYDEMCVSFHRGYPAGIAADDRAIAGVPCRVFAGAAPSVVYFHGGSFIFGGLNSHDDICAEICAATGLQVVVVDYRLSPEHVHPAAFEDALAVTSALAAEGPVMLVGDSAGGNLAAAVCHALRRSHVEIRGQVLIYPGLGGDRNMGSYVFHANAPMLATADIAFGARIRHGGPEPVGDISASPLQDSDFSGLPPTLAIAAECDPLADDAHAYAAALRAAGGKAYAMTAQGLVHGYLRARATVPRAAASFAQICAAITAFANSDWPFGDMP